MEMVYDSSDFPDLGKHIEKKHPCKLKSIKGMKKQKLNIHTNYDNNNNLSIRKELLILTESIAYKSYMAFNYDKSFDELTDLLNRIDNLLNISNKKNAILPEYLLKILRNYFPSRTEQQLVIQKLNKHFPSTFLINNLEALSQPPDKNTRGRFSIDFSNNMDPIIAGEILADRLYLDYLEGQTETQLLQDIDLLLYLHRQKIENNDLKFEDEYIKKYSDIIPSSFINKLKTYFNNKRLVLLLIRYINEFDLIQCNNIVPYMNETQALHTLHNCLDILLQLFL